MKRKIYKRYRTGRKKGGQRYLVGKKSINFGGYWKPFKLKESAKKGDGTFPIMFFGPSIYEPGEKDIETPLSEYEKIHMQWAEDINPQTGIGKAYIEKGLGDVNTPDDALEFLEDHPRSIFSKKQTEKLMEAFRQPGAIEVKSPEELEQRGALLHTREEGVGADSLSKLFAQSLDITPIDHKYFEKLDSPYLGRGKQAEFITKENIKKIREKIGGGR